MLVDLMYYQSEYEGVSEIDAPSFSVLSKQAERDIQRLTYYKVLDFTKLPVWSLERVKEAICIQIEYLNEFGATSSLGMEGGSSFSIGSYSEGNKSSNSTATTPWYAQSIEYVLLPTGLLHRGVGVW